MLANCLSQDQTNCSLSQRWQRELDGSSRCIIPYLYTRLSIYCRLSMCVTIASVSSYLVIRTWRLLENKRKENRKENKYWLSHDSQSILREVVHDSGGLQTPLFSASLCSFKVILMPSALRTDSLTVLKLYLLSASSLTFMPSPIATCLSLSK